MSDRWNGVPSQASASGWHWVEDATGLRPLLWRGDDWPDQTDRHEWEDGVVVCSPHDLRGSRYFGPVTMPAAVAERFQQSRLGGFSPVAPRSWAARLGIQY